MAKTTEADVLATIQKALGADGKKITFNSRMGDSDVWDSLGHLGILAALDKQFQGKVAGIREMATADSVKTILQLLKKHSLI
ncbi:MAG: acyl carrier protein [Elusimicrobiota bacterium]|jgi:acyl carrier protein